MQLFRLLQWHDVKAVYEKYIKGKNFIETSFVPKGQVNLIAEGSVNAGIVEEDVTKAAEVKADDIAEEPIVKTPTKFDRSVMPAIGPDPEVTIPQPWTCFSFKWNENMGNKAERTSSCTVFYYY